QIFSRGQQKLHLFALQLPQGQIHNPENDNNCIYLIDDINSELDSIHTLNFFNYLKQIKSKDFITTTEKNNLNEFIDTN
ncbi:DNA replication and repair protein RecF, partial [Francisella tularensis subsp. holarctica]|nr:DNA replication and repair protein RecF [Francisella tularensis subsp. holarctica]